MIRHVVSFQLAANDEGQRAEHAHQVRDRLHALRDVGQGVIALEVFADLGDSPSHWPLVMIADFVDRPALDEYQSHPLHLEVVTWMNSGIISDRVVVDFEVP